MRSEPVGLGRLCTGWRVNRGALGVSLALLAVVGCLLSPLSIPGEAQLACTSIDECPEGSACPPDVGLCVSLADPCLLSAELTVANGTVCGDEQVCVRARCVDRGCGNGLIEAEEACDDGPANAERGDACRPDCTLPRCGDGIADRATEVCDDETATCVRCARLCANDTADCNGDPRDGCECDGLAPILPRVEGDSVYDVDARGNVTAASLDEAGALSLHSARLSGDSFVRLARITLSDPDARPRGVRVRGGRGFVSTSAGVVIFDGAGLVEVPGTESFVTALTDDEAFFVADNAVSVVSIDGAVRSEFALPDFFFADRLAVCGPLIGVFGGLGESGQRGDGELLIAKRGAEPPTFNSDRVEGLMGLGCLDSAVLAVFFDGGVIRFEDISRRVQQPPLPLSHPPSTAITFVTFVDRRDAAFVNVRFDLNSYTYRLPRIGGVSTIDVGGITEIGGGPGGVVGEGFDGLALLP